MDVILTYKNGGFDALAAAFAASKIYPGAAVVTPVNLNPAVRGFISLYGARLPLVQDRPIDEPIDLVIVVGAAGEEDVCREGLWLDQAERIIVYAHRPGSGFLKAQKTRIELAGAATTVLLEEIIEKRISLNRFEANLLALGIYEGTFFLTAEKTKARDARALAYLWMVGLKTAFIRRHLQLPRGKNRDATIPPPELPVLQKEDNLASLLEKKLPVAGQRLLRKAGYLAARSDSGLYLVGGVIRDLLLGYPPEKDLDFIVTGDAIAFARDLNILVGGTVRIHEKFGTASIVLEENMRLDLISARREFYSSPAALPKVERSSLKNDLFRRDFTINTLACPLAGENYGLLIDFFQGKSDLQKGLIRVLYQLSFVDDPLRILRAIRFEQRYGFRLEEKTGELLARAVDRRVIDQVSRQRLNKELQLVFNEPSPLKILKRFDQIGILSDLYPRLETDRDTWLVLAAADHALRRVVEKGWKLKLDPEAVYLSGLLLGLDSAERSAIIKRLNLEKEKADLVIRSCRDAPAVLKKLSGSHLRPSVVAAILDQLPAEAIILADALSKEEKAKEYICLYFDRLRHLKPKIGGEDLKTIGLIPGPQYGELLKNLRQAVLDGEVKTISDEIEYVKKAGRPLPEKEE